MAFTKLHSFTKSHNESHIISFWDPVYNMCSPKIIQTFEGCCDICSKDRYTQQLLYLMTVLPGDSYNQGHPYSYVLS